MKRFLQDPWFIGGLLLRLALVLWLYPRAEATWYVPFLEHSVESFSPDPWRSFMDSHGNLAAFPYGYAMWLAFLPLTLFCTALGMPVRIGYGLTLIIADLLLLAVLSRLHPGKPSLLVKIYWWSPIVLVASYALGHNDLIPVVLLCFALLLTRGLRLRSAGFAFGTAVSAKLSMALAIPFLLIYLYNNKSLRTRLPELLQGLTAAATVFLLPFLWSGAGLHMLFNNPELSKVYKLSLQVGGDAELHLLPMAYVLMLYATWRVRRLNFELFQVCNGIAFLVVVLMTAASPGWFIWTVPLLVYYQLSGARSAQLLATGFSLLFALEAGIGMLPASGTSGWLAGALALADGVLRTLITATGVILVFHVWRDTVSRNDYFRLSRKPFVIGIAGDSGAGKDTYVNALIGLFGQHSSVSLSGDDYHLWDRQQPMWKVLTHLNPRANDLEAYAGDLLALAGGRDIIARHYDHATGKKSQPFKVGSNDFIFASGLHALYLPALRNCYDLRIFLDIDERLRRHFKIRRDTCERGHAIERVLSAIARRGPDADRFIRPQAEHADLVLSLQPIHPQLPEPSVAPGQLKLKLRLLSRIGMSEMSLSRVLVGVCGLYVETLPDAEGGWMEMIIEGEVDPEDMAMAAGILCPRVLDFLDVAPKWEGGMLGLMQLLTLTYINQILNKRMLC